MSIQTSKTKYGFIQDRIIALSFYVLAIFAGWLSILFTSEYDLWVQIGIADIIATVVIFFGSYLFKNSSLYDPYWSVLPFFIAFYLIITFDVSIGHSRIIMLLGVLSYWSIRLTVNWLKTWPGFGHEDWRYQKLAEDTKSFYWPVSFLGIHLFPTVLVFLGCLPFDPILESTSTLQWTDFLGFFISIVGVEMERNADNQLRKFKLHIATIKSKVCSIGLWNYSRHPNYFGEILFWAGISIMAIGLNPDGLWVYGIGSLSMILLFTFISIPMMEKRQILKDGYTEYQKSVSMLIPWFPKK